MDRDAAARLGITPQVIDDTLYDAFGQRQVSTVYKRYNQHHVILEVNPQYLTSPDSCKKSSSNPPAANSFRWPRWQIFRTPTPIFQSITRGNFRR